MITGYTRLVKILNFIITFQETCHTLHHALEAARGAALPTSMPVNWAKPPGVC